MLRKKASGFHEMSSITQSISMHDDCRIKIKPSQRFTLSIRYHNIHIPGEASPTYPFIHNFYKHHDIQEKISIDVYKRIPLSSGMGGSSTNGANIIKILNQLYPLNYSNDDLASFCFPFSKDMPFFFYKPTALVEGEGERTQPIDPILAPSSVILLVDCKPGLSTQVVFDQYQKQPHQPSTMLCNNHN